MPEKEAPLSPVDGLLRSFAIHNRIHLYLLDALPAEAWQGVPPGGKGRTPASMVAHIHGGRLMWLKATGVKALPEPLEKAASIGDAKKALSASAAAIHAMLEAKLNGDARISGFKPDAWAFVSYLIAH